MSGEPDKCINMILNENTREAHLMLIIKIKTWQSSKKSTFGVMLHVFTQVFVQYKYPEQWNVSFLSWDVFSIAVDSIY